MKRPPNWLPHRLLAAAVLAAAGLAGCASDDHGLDCQVVEANGTQYCVVRRDAITETGYDCPPEFAFPQTTRNLVVCGKSEGLPTQDAHWLEERYGGGTEPGEADAGASTPGPDRPLDPNAFGRQCETYEDCVLVDPKLCPDCACAEAVAIGIDALEAFEDAKMGAVCEDDGDSVCAAACRDERIAVCDDGTCRAAAPPAESGSITDFAWVRYDGTAVTALSLDEGASCPVLLCEGSTPARAGAPIYRAAGRVLAGPSAVVPGMGEVEILVPLSDPDCRLPCGTIGVGHILEEFVGDVTAGGAAGGALTAPGDLPCGPASQVHFRILLDTPDIDFWLNYDAATEDVCGATSPIAFEIGG